MSEDLTVPLLRDEDGAPETVYLTRSPAQTTADGWWVSSLDVGSWRPLATGDRVVALDRDSPAEFVVEVVEGVLTVGEVFYRLRHVADADVGDEPHLGSTRSGPQSPGQLRS